MHSDVELKQKITMTKPTTSFADIECTFPSKCLNYIHWYQKKDGEPFKRVQYVKINDQTIRNEPGFESLTSVKTGNQFVLIIPNLKTEHSAVYYCACWVRGSTVRLKLRALYNNPQSEFTASSQTSDCIINITQVVNTFRKTSPQLIFVSTHFLRHLSIAHPS